MNILFNRPSTAEAAAIRERIFVFRPRRATRWRSSSGYSISSSARTRKPRARSVVRFPIAAQQTFLDEYCQDDGDLLLLILDDSTTSSLVTRACFPGRPDQQHCLRRGDYSMLCRTVGRTVGIKLFTRINSYAPLPQRLLRPPRLAG